MTTNLELSLRLLVTAKRILGDAIKNLNTDTRSRSWTLPATVFADEVSHYRARHSELALPGPRPCLDNRRKLAAADIALKIDAAAKLRDLGSAADPLIKPVLLYYSAAHVLGAYSRAFWAGTAMLKSMESDVCGIRTSVRCQCRSKTTVSFLDLALRSSC
jgi:hypothetical protein